VKKPKALAKPKKKAAPAKRTAIPGHGGAISGGAGHGKPKPPKPKHESAAVRAKHHKSALLAAKTRKHNAAKHHKKVKLALGDEVSCCAAEALAASLRLAGWTVTDADVLELYRHTASYDDEGASIEETLRAASVFGLAGVRPESFALTAIAPFGCRRSLPSRDGPGYRQDYGAVRAPQQALIIGLELPGGPHALTLDPSGAVWSWGELYDPAQLQPGPVEQAWLVDWRL
jgi:hypothetical protein